MRIEDFPIGEEALKEFLPVNRPVWAGVTPDPGRPPVYVNLSMVRMQVTWVLPKLIYARGMAETLNCPIRVLTWRENPALTELFSSFGAENIPLDPLCHRRPGAFLKALGKTLQAFFSCSTGEKLQGLKLSGLSAGYSLYEDMLRTSDLSTIRKARNKIVLKKLLHLSWSFYALEKEIRERGISFGLMDDEAYHEGIYARLFLSRGARCRSSNDVTERGIEVLGDGTFDRDLWNHRYYYEESFPGLGEAEVKEAEHLVTDRFQGKNGRKIDAGAFAGEVPDREELSRRMGLEPGKRNVFIMAHTFSDGVMNQGKLYFRDYYDWLEQTLKMARDIPEVNWILKPHPTRSAYNEAKDSVEAMYERLKAPHIYLFPDEVSARASAALADCVVTIGGNAGLEYACLGVPVIITGKPFYHGFGFTIEPRTPEAYAQSMKETASLPRLSPEQVSAALKLFYLRQNISRLCPAYYRDDFKKTITRHYDRMVESMALEYFAGNEGSKPYNTESLKAITEWMRTGDLRQTEYYRRGKEQALNLKPGDG